MKLSLISLGLAAATMAFIACADSAENDADEGAPDGSTVPQTDAGSGGETTDAGEDAADVVVPPRVCSDQGFCRTVLPAGKHELRGVWGDGAGIAWAIGAEGEVLRFDGNGWKVHASGLGKLAAIWGSGPTDVWIAGEDGVQHGTGASSAALAFAKSALPGGAKNATSVWGTGPNDVWVVASIEVDGGPTESRVYRWSTGDAGVGWSEVAVPQGVFFDRVWGSAGSGVWLAGKRPIPDEWFEECVIFRRAALQKAFEPMALPKDPDDTSVFATLGSVRGAAAMGDQTIWIHGHSVVSVPRILRATSTDGGATFTWTFTRPTSDDEPVFNAVSASAPNDAWAVGDFGQVRRWDGSAWATAGITPAKVPITDPFYGVWSRAGAEAWLVGKDIALRWDPSKKDGGN